MRKVRVLIVDDSTVMRRMLSDSLAADPQIEIAGTAAQGRIALAKIPQVNPDVVTLDMEMPEMDGVATLVEIRKLYPKLPVVMFSTLTQKGATATFDALAKGADDYVTKPANVGSVGAAMNSVRSELAPKLKALCPWIDSELLSRTPRTTSKLQGDSHKRIAPVEAVVIGSSTGGPNALQAVISDLPANFPVPILIVQHMPPVFTKHLADRLDTMTQLSVKEAQSGEAIHAGGVWIAPGDQHLQVVSSENSLRIKLNQGIPENSCRPAVDVLFRSANSIFRRNLLAVVLTGMGKDGLRGCEEIQATGGHIIAQDQASSVVWGMPGAVTRAGLATAVEPLSRIASEICSVANQNRQRTARKETVCH